MPDYAEAHWVTGLHSVDFDLLSSSRMVIMVCCHILSHPDEVQTGISDSPHYLHRPAAFARGVGGDLV